MGLVEGVFVTIRETTDIQTYRQPEPLLVAVVFWDKIGHRGGFID